MRRTLFALLAAATALGVSTGTARAAGRNLDGQMAPEIRLVDGLNGASASTTLASLRGKVVCLKFWLTHCPICRGTLPDFQELHNRYSRSGVVCLSVVYDTAQGVSPYLREAGWTFPVGCDPTGYSSTTQYGVDHFPGDYVIGVDGVVRSSSGFPREVIEEELRKQRVAEWGAVPASLRGAQAAVEDGDYGEALRISEPLAKAKDAAADVVKAVARLTEIARARLDNRLARVDAYVRVGRVAEARQQLAKIAQDFRDTSLAAVVADHAKSVPAR
jgi:peroxiredoxin